MPKPESHSDSHIILALFLFVLAVYLATASLRFHSIDEIAVFSVTRSLVGRVTFDGDVIFWTHAPLGRGSIVAQGIDGHSYVVKDVAPSILSAPLVWLANRIGVSPVRAALLFSVPVAALTAGLLYRVIRLWGYGQATGILGGLTFALASLIWPYAQTLFTQPLAALGLLIALHGVIRAQEGHGWQAALLGGLGLGLAGLSAVPLWVSTSVFVLYLVPWEAMRSTAWRGALQRIIAFGVGAGLFAAFQAIYNLMRFGSPLQTGYQQVGASSIRLLHFGLGSFGLLFSLPRGVIWFAPFVLLVPFGVALGWRSCSRRRYLLALGLSVAVYLLYSSYATWWAGLCWGPRFLVAVMPTLTLLTVPVLDRVIIGSASFWERISVGLLLLVSMATQLMAVSFDYLESEAEVSLALHLITPPPAFVVWDPVLTDLRLIPLLRQLESAQQGAWDLLAFSSGHPDGLLIAAQVVIVLLAGLWLVVVMRWGASRLTRLGLLAQTGLSVVLAAFMLLRYSQGPHAEPGLDSFVAALSARTQPGDGIVTVLPVSYLAWIDSYDGTRPDIGFVFENPLSAESEQMLKHVARWHQRVWLVSEGTVGGNPDNGVERWLAEHGFVGTEEWIEGYRLIPYSFARSVPELKPVGQGFGVDEIVLDGAWVEQVEHPDGGWLNVWLRWTTPTTPKEDYTVFVHVIDAAGMLVAQHDGVPMAGYTPTTSWRVGMVIDDRHTVALSPDLPAGAYQVLVGLYGANQQRLTLSNGSGDALLIETVLLAD